MLRWTIQGKMDHGAIGMADVIRKSRDMTRLPANDRIRPSKDGTALKDVTRNVRAWLS